MRRIFDCDWLILTTTTIYNYAYTTEQNGFYSPLTFDLHSDFYFHQGTHAELFFMSHFVGGEQWGDTRMIIWGNCDVG